MEPKQINADRERLKVLLHYAFLGLGFHKEMESIAEKWANLIIQDGFRRTAIPDQTQIKGLDY